MRLNKRSEISDVIRGHAKRWHTENDGMEWRSELAIPQEDLGETNDD